MRAQYRQGIALVVIVAGSVDSIWHGSNEREVVREAATWMRNDGACERIKEAEKALMEQGEFHYFSIEGAVTSFYLRRATRVSV